MTAGRIWNSGIFSNQFFLFLIKRISVLNQNIFYFESTIVSNCVSDSSRVNSIVGVKTSKPIIFELEPDPDIDRLTLGPIRNFPWLKNMPVRQSVKTGHSNQAGRDIVLLGPIRNFFG